MGIYHHDGYSATVEGFLVVGDDRIRLAKTNGFTFSLAESCDLAPGTQAELLIIVDGSASARRIVLPQGVSQGQVVVEYELPADPTVPF